MADNPNPFSSIISKLTDVFNNFKFPPLPLPQPPPVKVDTVAVDDVVAEEKPVSASGVDVDVVQVKVDESGDQVQHVTNPALMWQVYAIGGFFLLKWAVARWKEQRKNKKPSDEDSPPPTASETNE